MGKKQFILTTTQFILIAFLAVIVIGSILLSLPISSADGVSVGYLDALFTATTATCVTGLTVLPTVSAWSVFGQAVILVLIQIGGLGVITILSGLMILMHRKIGLSDRLLIQDAFNLNTLSGLVRFVKRVFLGTFVIEAVGALLYMTVFVPEFGLKGVWISVFNSVSAFCNAGMDIVSTASLCNYTGNVIINLVTMALIVLGGLGYIVWWDIIRVIKEKKSFSFLTLHTKIVLVMTLVLIVGGQIAILVFEYNNPLTIGNLSFSDKLMATLFQSVTTRTAGFMTIDQASLTDASGMVSMLLMFIGGSPVGTAGGVKTVTIAVILATAAASVRGKNDVTLFNRNLSSHTIKKAVAVTVVSFFVTFVSTVLLMAVSEADVMAVLYETVSATATVGLSKNLTPSLNVWGKMIIIMAMYFGRVGPISFAIALNRKSKSKNLISNPTEEISVG